MVLGSICRKKNSLSIEIFNWGWGASTTVNQADESAVWTPINMLPRVKPDLTFIALDTNDYTPAYGPVPFKLYRENLSSLARAAHHSGECVIVTEIPSSPERQMYQVQNFYHDIQKQVADAQSCGLLDISRYWSYQYEPMAKKGWYMDTTHGTSAAYEYQGKLAAQWLLSLNAFVSLQ